MYLQCDEEVAELGSVVAPARQQVDAVAGQGEAAAGGSAHRGGRITSSLLAKCEADSSMLKEKKKWIGQFSCCS